MEIPVRDEQLVVDEHELVDVLENPEKRQALTEMTNWPTLPKVFINGQFYGDTDILDPMEASGEIEPLLKVAFGEEVPVNS